MVWYELVEINEEPDERQGVDNGHVACPVSL
jgi:hypothetical protein